MRVKGEGIVAQKVNARRPADCCATSALAVAHSAAVSTALASVAKLSSGVLPLSSSSASIVHRSVSEANVYATLLPSHVS